MDVRGLVTYGRLHRPRGRAIRRNPYTKIGGSWLSGFFQPSVEDCVSYDVDAAAQFQFAHRVRLVHLDSFNRDAQGFGDFLVTVADGHHAKDLLFTLAHRRRAPGAADRTVSPRPC